MLHSKVDDGPTTGHETQPCLTNGRAFFKKQHFIFLTSKRDSYGMAS